MVNYSVQLVLNTSFPNKAFPFTYFSWVISFSSPTLSGWQLSTVYHVRLIHLLISQPSKPHWHHSVVYYSVFMVVIAAVMISFFPRWGFAIFISIWNGQLASGWGLASMSPVWRDTALIMREAASLLPRKLAGRDAILSRLVSRSLCWLILFGGWSRLGSSILLGNAGLLLGCWGRVKNSD